MAFCVIFGAGKIARGFIGHLLYISGHEFVFVEKSRELCDLINKKGGYTVNIFGAPEKNCTVRGAHAICIDDSKDVTEAIARAEMIFTAMGGKNLPDFCRLYAESLRRYPRVKTQNVITCENWKEPAKLIQETLLKIPDINEKILDKVGFAESVVMRSAIEPESWQLENDPLWVNVQDFWKLPVDRSALKGVLPEISGVEPIENFNGFLEKKFYTYNAANGTVAYLGALKGYTHIHEAARDDFILEILSGVYRETGEALCAKYQISEEEMKIFSKSSLDKLQNIHIVDYIERNARDPIRKLGKDDRLIGSSRLCLQYGILPSNLAVSAAAAIHYRSENDPFAVQLAELRKSVGTEGILQQICELEKNSALYNLIIEQEKMLMRIGLISGEESNG